LLVDDSRPIRLAGFGLSMALGGAGILIAVLFSIGAFDGSNASAGATGRVGSPAAPTGVPLDAAAIYRNTAPAVTAITATGVTAETGEGKVTASGTGFVIDTRGDVLTASHVVDGASSITVKLPSGTTRSARLLGLDLSIDAAVLHIDQSGLALRPLALGSSAALSVGDPLAVIGDPFGFNRSLSTGVVSGLDRAIPAPNGAGVPDAIQTDAAIDPGNSGGPVLTSRAQVVGITDQIATGGTGATSSTGVGFAIPIDVVKAELSQLEHGAQVSHAFLGAAVATSLTESGAQVGSVMPGSPAMAAGIREGDIIIRAGSTVIRGPNGLVRALSAHRPGEQLTLTVRRGPRITKATVTLGSQPVDEPGHAS
jgi:putative serine protease PepD